ncbi:MAG: HEAT repeat domain-containing protein, partial [Bdellovibrionota bacterium]
MVRNTTIEQLSALGDPASVRELIEIVRTNPWRETRMAAIRGIGTTGRWRGIELLMEIATDARDLPMALTAIQALGTTRNPLAGRFLIQLATQGPEPLAPSALSAAAVLPERLAGEIALAWAQSAVRDGRLDIFRYAHLKAALFALGELKIHLGIPYLRQIVELSKDTQITAAAIAALGKISRLPTELAAFSARCGQDPYLHGVWSTARNQIGFRSQWHLESYLNRIFTGPDPHDSTYFELNSFPMDDVKAGLSLYLESHPEKIQRFCHSLAALSGPAIATGTSRNPS